MNKQVIMLVLVVAVVILGGVQAYQISDIKSDIKEGTIGVTGAATSGPSNARPAQQAAPTMVGGC